MHEIDFNILLDLRNLLVCYFNQDMGSPEKASDEILQRDNETVKSSIFLIEHFLGSNLTKNQKKIFIENNTCIYFPNLNISPIQWLENLLDKLKTTLDYNLNSKEAHFVSEVELDILERLRFVLLDFFNEDMESLEGTVDNLLKQDKDWIQSTIFQIEHFLDNDLTENQKNKFIEGNVCIDFSVLNTSPIQWLENLLETLKLA